MHGEPPGPEHPNDHVKEEEEAEEEADPLTILIWHDNARHQPPADAPAFPRGSSPPWRLCDSAHRRPSQRSSTRLVRFLPPWPPASPTPAPPHVFLTGQQPLSGFLMCSLLRGAGAKDSEVVETMKDSEAIETMYGEDCDGEGEYQGDSKRPPKKKKKGPK